MSRTSSTKSEELSRRRQKDSNQNIVNDSLHRKENNLGRIEKLDYLLKAVKRQWFDADGQDVLRQEVKGLGGLVEFLDQNDTADCPVDDVLSGKVKALVLGATLRRLLNARHNACWLKMEVEKPRPIEGHSLLARATEFCAVDTTALLLARGAHPGDNQMEFTFARKIVRVPEFKQTERLLALEIFIIEHSREVIPILTVSGDKDTSVPRTDFQELRDLRGGPLAAEDILKGLASHVNEAGQMTWIHIPYTNCPLILAKIKHLGTEARKLFEFLFENTRRDIGDPLLEYMEILSWPNQLRLELPQVTSLLPLIDNLSEVNCDAVTFPCLVLSTVGDQLPRRDQHTKLVDRVSSIGISLDGTHSERTLDEAYYPGLSAAENGKRNRDQTVYHSRDDFASYDSREKGKVDIEENAFIRMVPQLWLYRLGNVFISAHGMTREGRLYQGLSEGIDNMPTRWVLDGAQSIADDHLTMVMASHIDDFGKKQYHEGVTYPPALDLFEIRVMELLCEVTQYSSSVPGRKTGKLVIRQERYFLHVISNVRSELAMTKNVLEQQERIFNNVLESCAPKRSVEEGTQEPIAPHDPPQWTYVHYTQGRLQHYMRRVAKIDGDAERIEKIIQDMLNLKRTHASIKDSHSSLIVSTAVIGFTVITIVFAPLAFLTALFALRIDGFKDLQVFGKEGVYNGSKFGGIFVSTEILTLALTYAAIKIAFWYINYEDEHDVPSKQDATDWKRIWIWGTAWVTTDKQRKRTEALDVEAQKKYDEKHDQASVHEVKVPTPRPTTTQDYHSANNVRRIPHHNQSDDNVPLQGLRKSYTAPGSSSVPYVNPTDGNVQARSSARNLI